MRRLIVQAWMTLDGVVQAPGASDEDTTGGFEHGGWSLPYFDEVARTWLLETLTGAGGFVLGRRTYEILAAYWPSAPEEEHAIAEPLNRLPKYVASRTLADPLEWQNATVLSGSVPEAVAALKREEGDDLVAIGSVELVHTLIRNTLVDRFQVMIDPLVVGGGKRLFQPDGALLPLRLVESRATSAGAILATYVPAGAE